MTNDDDEERVEYCYGIPMPVLPEGLQPLDCVVLIKGLMMDSGQPTITALGSRSMTPWDAVGLLEMESHRLKMGYTLTATYFGDDDEEDDA